MKDSCRVNYDRRHTAGPFFGRLLLSIIFILSGLSKIAFFKESAAMLRSIDIKGAEAYITIALIFELVGGLLILLGWFTRVGCYILMIFLVATTILMHPFWKYSGHEMQMQLANFLKNTAIFGGLILLASYGAGRWSLDAKTCEKEREAKNP